MQSFIFGGNTGETPDSIKRKREIANALLASQAAPKNLGEGLNALGDGIVANVMNRRANEAEKTGQASGNAAMADIMGALFGGDHPAAPGAADTFSSMPQPGSASELAASKPFSGGQQAFVDTLMPAAMEESKRTGIDPRIIVAQAAQETGWGKSAPGNNFFGIKSHGQEGGNSLMTTEYVDGKPVQQRDSFRAYGSPQDSVRGYGDFILQNPRYKPLREAQGMDAQLAALQASGYATDPNYSRSVGAIARGIRLPTETASLDPTSGMAPAADAIDAQAARSGYVDPMVSSPNYDPVAAGAKPEAAERSKQQIAQALTAPEQSQGDGKQQIMKALMAGASNPWLNENQRQIVSVLLGDQFDQQKEARVAARKQADPAYQMGLEKGQLELDQLRNGQWSRLDDGRLYNQRTGDIKDAPVNPNATPADLGLNPQYGVDANGNPVILQLGKNGKVVQSQMPQGVTLSKEPIKLDAGTHYVLLDPITRQPVGQVPKDLAGAEAEKAGGKAQGEARAALPQVQASANELLASIDSLANDQYLGNMLGPFDSRTPNLTSDAARVQSKMDQIGGQAFMQAFNNLRGAGQITEQEGSKATAAMGRLNTAQSEADYRAALDELRGVVQRAVGTAQQKAGGGGPVAPGAGVIQPAGGLDDLLKKYGG